MQKTVCALILYSSTIIIKAEERLSWFTTDGDIRKSIFVPDNLSEGKEENRALPWVFHDMEEKIMELKCIMRGFNDSNNPSDYKEARWSYPGFDASQVDTNTPAKKGEENGEEYAIWTIKITTSAEDAGMKWATCEWQQGDFPLSTDLKFLIFRRRNHDSLPSPRHVDHPHGVNKTLRCYDLGGPLDEKDMTQQIEDDIKSQISAHYSMPATNVTRSSDGQEFCISVNTIVLDAFNPTVIIIVITVLIAAVIITLFGVKFRERIRSTVCENCEIMLSKISTT